MPLRRAATGKADMHSGRWTALLAVSCALGACSGANDPPRNDAPIEVAAPPAGTLPLDDARMARIGVRFAVTRPAREIPLATVPAMLAPPPNARVAVAAVIPGVVTRTLVVEGDTVTRGQALAVVAARELFTLGAGAEQASARVAVARANDARLGQLAREGVIAAARAEEARAALREAQAELSEQRRMIRSVNGAPQRGTYTLTAPIAGKVTSAAIQTGSPVDGTTSAYVIDAASRYELTAQLPERLLGRIRPGMTVRLPGDVRGTVTSVGSVLDPQTRSATLRARVPAAPGVVSGRAVPAMLFGAAPDGTVLLPVAAVTEVNGRPSVFVRNSKGVVVRPVGTGERAGGQIAVARGLRAGEQVAVSGVSELKSAAGRN